MVKAWMAAAIVVLATCGVSVAQGAIAGKTIKYTNSRGQTYWTTYHKDGTSFTRSTRLNGSGEMHDLGHWRYVHGVLCERYNNWSSGREFCR